MSAVEKHLMAGERVVHTAEMHWVRYARAACLVLLGAVALAVTGVEEPGVALLCFLFGALFGAVAFLDVATSRYLVTNRRVIFRRGILRRTSVDVLLDRLAGVHVQQSLLGRLLGFGTVVLLAPGGAGHAFHQVAAPMELCRQLNGQAQGASEEQ